MCVKSQYTHHALCFYQIVLFKIHHSIDNQVDDLASLYSDESNNLHIDILVGTIQLKTTHKIKFIIDDEAEISNDHSFSIDGTKYRNELFIYAKRPTPSLTIFISYDVIREKVVYKKDEYLNSFCEFHLFPNLLEFK